MSILLPLFIFVPLIAALLILLLYRYLKALPDIFGFTVTAVLFSFSIFICVFRPMNGIVIYQDLVLDGFSNLMVLTVNMIAFFAAVYSVSYMEKYKAKDKYYALFMLMLAGMNGVVLTGNMVNLFIFMEVASISGAALVAFGTKEEEIEASLKYLVIGAVASIFIFIGITILFSLSGSVNMAAASQSLPGTTGYARSFMIALFIIGFGTKAAIVPFHAWLPDAHPAAPAPISAMLSGILIKSLGIYSMTRIFYNVLGMTYPISMTFLILGSLSIIWGSFLAIGQWDMKRLFACSSISQVGYIIIGIGLATPLGVMGGLFHLFNHAVFKSLLFLNAGSVERETGTRNIRALGGISSKMPVTSNTSLVGSLALSGIPPFNGFWSKLFIILALVQAGRLWIALIAVVGSVMTLAYSLKVQRYAFFSGQVAELKNIKGSGWFMNIPMISLALLCLLMGIFFPIIVAYIINPAVLSLAQGVDYGQMIVGALR